MTKEEQTKEEQGSSTQKNSGCLAGLLFVVFVGGWIVFGFGAVGLYEDRKFLSLNAVLAAAGLLAIGVSFPLLVKASRAYEEVRRYSLGGGFCFLVWGIVRLVWKTWNDQPGWDQGISVLFIGCGMYQMMMAFRERHAAIPDDEGTSGD
ncbi:MAG: hypothetical protein MK165_02975 [Pirellulaceae bacterium]|nr:hypothetical protein [Pirellulaceae bacterium]